MGGAFGPGVGFEKRGVEAPRDKGGLGFRVGEHFLFFARRSLGIRVWGLGWECQDFMSFGRFTEALIWAVAAEGLKTSLEDD